MRNLQSKQNSGFTVVEMLAAVAIIVILLGISMVSVVRYRDMLKLAELDNAAREIYMAAENRAVLLSGARRLNSQVAGKNDNNLVSLAGRPDTEKLYYLSKADMTEELLTPGSIDPALREGDFYIVYDSSSGSVTDVFYAEQSMDSLMGSGFASFYSEWAKSRSARLEKKNQMLVGWYNGEAAEGKDIELEIPEEPYIKVMIKNEEELTVTVEYAAPGGAKLSVRLGDTELKNSMPLSGGEKTVSAGTGSYTWVLDSLTGERFRNLVQKEGNTIVAPGADFIVTASITSTAAAPEFEPASDSDKNNSLFQAGSGGKTAYIKYLRHLQNLDSAFSGVSGKTAAIQTGDIRCRDNETYPDYDFIPLYNMKLSSYDGRTREIRNLYVSGKNFSGHAGLFSMTGGGTSATPMTFKNIRLVNASITASENKYAGALVGSTSDSAIQNCWVYWEADETVTNLKTELVEDAEKDLYDYQINGKYAGGLVGYSQGNCTITGSLAATLVSGTDCAGGLIGCFDGSEAKVAYSYADCYLTGGRQVAGLIGNLNKGSAVLANCYAAGYILGESQAAGLCLGAGTTKAENVYTVVRRIGNGDFSPLTAKPEVDTFQNTYFLESEEWSTTGQAPDGTESLTFAEMSDESGGAMNAITGANGQFQWKTTSDGQSHPYNLRSGLTLTIYEYPGLKSLPHYGDWTTDFKGTSLVYYEQYSDNSCGISGGNINTLKDNLDIRSDGYAVVCRLDDLKSNPAVKIEYTWYQQQPENETTQPYSEEKQYETLNADYYDVQWTNLEGKSVSLRMFPLPAGLSNSDYAEDCFYRYLTFTVSAGSGTGAVSMNARAFYNPHFAETVLPITAKDGSITVENVASFTSALSGNLSEVKLRTPRHLYGLSRFKEYYTRSSRFRQVLDLDYASYTGYGLFTEMPYAQKPIGTQGEAFAGTYDGDYHSIRNVVPKAGEGCIGLFGFSMGTLRNIVYQMELKDSVKLSLDAKTNRLYYVGALAGGSSGTIENCSVSGVRLHAEAPNVILYMGGLVGLNQGRISSCEAECGQLSANFYRWTRGYIGGLAGENAASGAINISNSFAVGRINVEVDDTIETAYICGFAGWNYGTISNSYAALDLRSSGGDVEAYGFCCGTGSQTGTAYLDQGNFSYREASYAADYRRSENEAGSTTYAELTKKETAKQLGMESIWTGTEPDPETEYPYPVTVKDREGKYTCYFRNWPKPMPLGEMGVFYWEKMVDADGGGNPAYHLSALAVDPGKKTITKQTTLSTAHDDGRIVTDYGYGYYYKGTAEDSMVKLETENIGNTPYMLWSHRDNNSYLNFSTFNKLDPDKEREFFENDEKNKLDAIKEGEKASKARERAAQEGLSDMIEGYTFRCWNTYREAPKAANESDDIYRAKQTVAGLCLFRTDKNKPLDPNSGTFELTQGTLKVKFIVNPQFADAMSVEVDGGMACDEALKVKPGSKNNPYQVRSGLQLQDINWYDTAYTDVPVGLGNYSATRFPYLNKDYYWKQTHDIDWKGERKSYAPYRNGDKDNENGVFFPIAQGFVRNDEKGELSGWFGGTYDGGNYTLKNFNIGINEYNYQINAMGLFGVVKNAELKNIVMFSESGEDVVTIRGRSRNKHATDGAVKLQNDAYGWYAGGVLVGVARSSTISNCAVAGYTIRDLTTSARYASGYDVGGAIGGLVGMTDMALEKCTAITTIEIQCDHEEMANAPIRVGGLVGSTTASVTNCYTGGRIDVAETVDGKNAAIYAGRLIGGVGMEMFSTESEASVENCYSYLTLPEKGGAVKEVYNIGGRGRVDGNSGGTVTNNKGDYYYGTNARSGGGESVTYQQLAGQEPIAGKSIYELLTSYSPVTTTTQAGDLDIGGRYSYAPKNRSELQGLNYPFPTVLTQSDVFHVHYGGWPLMGIERVNGGRPVELEMFTQYTSTEKLKLSDGVAGGGTWRVGGSEGFEDFLEVKIQGQEGSGSSLEQQGGTELTLELTAKKKNDALVSLTVAYEVPNGVAYPPLTITVNIGAHVQLLPDRVSLFPNDAVNVELKPRGIGTPGGKVYDTELSPEGLSVTAVTETNGPVTAAVVPQEEQPDGTVLPPRIHLARNGEKPTEEELELDVTYNYTGNGYTEKDVLHQIEAALLALPESGWDEEGKYWTISFAGYKPEALAVAAANTADYKAAVSEDGFGIVLEKTEDGEIPKDGVKLSVAMTIDGLNHELVITVPSEPQEAAP